MQNTEDKDEQFITTKWSIDASLCTIDSKIVGVSHVLPFNINIKRFLKRGGISLASAKPGIEGEFYSILFQLYIEFGKRSFEESQKFIKLCGRVCPEQSIDYDIVSFAAEAILNDKNEYTDLTFYTLFKIPPLSEKMKKYMRQPFLEDDEDEELEEQRELVAPPNTAVSEAATEATAKTTPTATKKKKKTASSEEDRISLDPNVIWAKLVEEVIEMHEQKRPTRNVKAIREALKNLKPFEKYKQLKSKDQLSAIYDFYVNRNMASASRANITRVPLEHKTNLLSATSFFSVPSLAFARSPDCIIEHRPDTLLGKTFLFDGTNWTIQFPFRKYVIGISQLEFRNEQLYNRILPHNQIDQRDQTMAALSKILYDFESGSDIFKKWKKTNEQQNEEDSSPNNLRLVRGKNGRMELVAANSNANVDQLDSAKEAFDELLKKMGIYGIMDPNASSFTTANLERLSGKSLGTYLSPILNNYIYAYTNIEWQVQNFKSRFLRLKHMMEMNKTSHPVKSPTTVLYKCRVLTQRFGLREFSNLRTPQADISDPGKHIYLNGIQAGIYDRNIDISYTKVDPSLSQFANWELIKYCETAKVDAISAVLPNMLVSQYRLTAYTPFWDEKLRTNYAIESKKGGTGKSHCLHRLREICIEGTVENETYRSDKSNSTHAKFAGDGIVVFQETDPSLFQDGTNKQKPKGKNADGNRGRAFKDSLDGGEHTYRVCTIDSNGHRKTETHTVRLPTIYFMASNENLRQLMSESGITRWHIASYADGVSIGDILEYKTFENLQGTKEKDLRKRNIAEAQLIQAVMYELWKLIEVRVIEVPSIHVANIMLLMMVNELSRRGIQKAHARDVVRTVLLSRIKCMLDAICTTFFFKGSKYYQKTIELPHLLELERKLFVTDQHVVSAVGEQIDLYVDPSESVVLDCIRAYWLSLESSQKNFRYVSVQRKDARGDPLSFSRNDSTTNKGSYAKSNYDNVVHSEKDYDYMAFHLNGNLARLSEELHEMAQLLKKQTDYKISTNPDYKKTAKDVDKVPSGYSIEAVLNNWLKRSIICHSYMGNKYGVVAPNTSKEKTAKKVAFFDTRYFCINYEFIMGTPKELRKNGKSFWSPEEETEEEEEEEKQEEKEEENKTPTTVAGVDAVRQVLEKLLKSKGQRPQRLLFDCNSKLGYIRNIIEITAKDIRESEDYLLAISPLHMDAISIKILADKADYLDDFRKAECMLISMPLADYALRERNTALCISQEIVDPSFHNIKLFEDEHEGQQQQDNTEAFVNVIQTDEDYEENGGGYFLGRPLKHNVDFADFSKQKNLDQKINQIWRQLDIKISLEEIANYPNTEESDTYDKETIKYIKYMKKQLELENTQPHLCEFQDEGFNREDFIVKAAEYDKKSGEMIKAPLYHWQCESLPPSLRNNARLYKLFCVSPAIIDDLANQRFYQKTQRNWYPREAIAQVKQSHQSTRDVLTELVKNDKNLSTAIRNNRIYVPGYTVSKDKKSIQADEYVLLSDLHGGESLIDMFSNNNKKRKRSLAVPQDESQRIAKRQQPPAKKKAATTRFSRGALSNHTLVSSGYDPFEQDSYFPFDSQQQQQQQQHVIEDDTTSF